MTIAAESTANTTTTWREETPAPTRLSRLIAFDDRLLRRIVRVRARPATYALRVLCRMYDPDVVACAIVIGLLGSPTSVRLADVAAIVLLATSFFVVLVKRTVKRARPASEVQALSPPDRFSFPSGHTAASFALAIAMVGVLPWLAAVLFATALLVAFGRMYLGVHYPMDVAAGALIGTVTGVVVAVSSSNVIGLVSGLARSVLA
jgi:undecaprenyl-diphosphatase